ncbi:hypothetical protein BDQ17DRAFT_1408378 [Cyathus striatus]|nr:hypothetical protein BDQ17DRAFT_1408378 [Cyathus striatus]
MHKSLSRPPKRRRIQVVDSDSDAESIPKERTSEDPTSRTTCRPRLKRGCISPRDISDEVDEQRILPSRMRARGKQTAFQKNLEKLKMRKQRKMTDDLTSDDKQDESDDYSTTPFEGARPSGEVDSEDESSYSDATDSFVVEDDEVVPQLPAQFSMETHQDLSFQFKKIFQFFVHVAMEGEEYFYVPLNTTRRKLLGLRDSLVASSVWSPTFKRTLELYPTLELVPLDFAIPYCDACHLGGRMSTLVGRVNGISYDRTGFEPVDDTQDPDEKADVKDEFHLGRFCARRTQVYHEFSHWEFHLFQCINQEIEQLRQSPNSKRKVFHKVAYAGGKLPPEDLSDADELCEWLDERKIVDMEWQKMKTMMDRARHLEMATKKGEED